MPEPCAASSGRQLIFTFGFQMKPITVFIYFAGVLPLTGLAILAVFFHERFRWEDTAIPLFVKCAVFGGLLCLLSTPVPLFLAVFHFVRRNSTKTEQNGTLNNPQRGSFRGGEA